MSIRSTERLTGVHRDTIMRLGARVGRGCAELHDRMMVGIRAGRLEFDALWSYVGKKQRQLTRNDSPVKGDQYTFIALASSARAIIAYHTGKRDSANTDSVRARFYGAACLASRKSPLTASRLTCPLSAMHLAIAWRMASWLQHRLYAPSLCPTPLLVDQGD